MRVVAIQRTNSFPSYSSPSIPPHESLAPLFRLLDEESKTQIGKFRRLEDAQRCLLGRLIPRFVVAQEFRIYANELRWGKRQAGKPFASHPKLPTSFDYNVSHDSDWVVGAYTNNIGSERRIGVDVMKIAIPWEGETADGLVDTVAEQLTAYEKRWISSSSDDQDKVERALALWTLKESYTKALGLGLGLDFQSIEFRFEEGARSGLLGAQFQTWQDGTKLEGWKFYLCLFGGYWLAVALEGGIDATWRNTVEEASMEALPSWLTVVHMKDVVSVIDNQEQAQR